MFKLINNIKTLYLINVLSILLVGAAIFSNIYFKTRNITLSNEINYITKRIAEQNNDKKILQSELAIITSPKYLNELYAGLQITDRNRNFAAANVENFETFASIHNETSYSARK
jgi:hypothetical protein